MSFFKRIMCSESKRRIIPSSVSISGDKEDRSEIVITDKDREERYTTLQMVYK